jgi:putative peptidoglycan lipid II flippase
VIEVEDEVGRGGLLAANVSVALGTLLSRLTGLLRVVVLGVVIGQGALADAYTSANNSPNSVYELILGGVLSATLVPLFTRHLEEKDEEATNAVVSVAVVALAALTAAGVLAAPLIFRLFSLSPSSDVDAGEFRTVGTSLARIFLIQIFFYGLMALFAALLNARRHFFAPAWSPVLANLVIIAGLLLVPSVLDDREPSLDTALDEPMLRLALAVGATAGISLMALALIPALRRAGIRLRFTPQWRHPAVAQLVRLSGWTLGYVAANQVALIIVQNLADPGSGQQDAYAKAFTFFQLPHGLLAMSIATTFVPDLARFVQRREKDAFIERTSLGVRLIALLTMPASFGYLVLGRPLIGAFLEHGEFGPEAAERTTDALTGFALGLVGFSVFLFALRGFYAHQDTRTPFMINLGQNVLRIVLSIPFAAWWGVLGLGLAFAVAYLVSAVWALQVLAFRVPGFALRPLYATFWRALLASVLMAEAVWLVTRVVGGDTGGAAWLRIIVGIVVGAAVYVGLLVLQRDPDLGRLRQLRPA